MQEKPLDASAVYREFTEQYETAAEKYSEKRIEIMGVVRKIGPDIHGKPSIELSDRADGRCYVLFIFDSDEFYSRVSVGDTVVCRGNFLSARESFGAVIKRASFCRNGKMIVYRNAEK